MTFFECQTELPQPFPEAADADLHIVFRQEPGLQFGKRRIGFAHNAGTKSFVIRSKLWLGAACPGTGARLSRLLPTSQNFVDIGHADPEDGRSGISARSRIHCRHHPFAQVLRVSSPHTVPPSNQRREGIKNSAPMEYASDSINSERCSSPDFSRSPGFGGAGGTTCGMRSPWPRAAVALDALASV